MTDVFAEQMTGLPEHPKGFGQIHDDKGNPLTIERARDVFNDGETIEIPNAGAGSYENVLTALGYQEVKEIEWSSSAGDWIFAAYDGENWHVVYQSNRHPYYGFAYSRHELSFDSYEDACNFVCEG